MARITLKLPKVAPRTDAPKAKSDAKAKADAKKKKTYRVRNGETLTAISRKFQCDTHELAQANKIKAPRYNIRPGQTLSLEGCTAN